MNYELKKVFTNRYAVLLLAAVVLVNAWLFFLRCTDDSDGFSLQQVRAKYSSTVAELESENTLLEERAATAFLTMNYADETLLTGDVLSEQALNRELILRKQEAQDYPAFLLQLLADAAFKLHSGLFGEDNSFSLRALTRTQKIYQALEGIKPADAFSGGIDIFSGWHLSDIFLLLFGCIPALLLLTQERSAGLFALLRPTKKGHAALYLRKFAAMSLLLSVGFLLTYGVDFALAFRLLGIENLSSPIQSVYGFRSCPLPLTVLGYLLFFCCTKLLLSWCSCAVFFAVCCVMERAAASLLCAGLVLGGSLVMGASGNLWLRSLSLSHLSGTEVLYQHCLFLDFFGTPLWQLPVALLFCTGLLLLGIFGGLWVFCRRSAIVTVRTRCRSLHLLSQHTSLFLHEGHKVWLTHGALLFVLLFAVTQFFSYRDFRVPVSDWEYHYKSYSAQFSGTPNADTDAFLSAERERFAEIYDEIAAKTALAQGDTVLAGMLTNELQQELRPEAAFESAAAQYQGLREGQCYIYRSGYERLYGAQGQCDTLRNTAFLLFFLSLALSGVFAVEQESGMHILQTTAGANRKVLRRKLAHCAILLSIMLLLAYLPQYLAVQAGYTLPQQEAMANSLAIFAAFSDGWTIRSVLLASGLAHLLLAAGASALILFFSQKTGNQITTLLLSIGTLVLPVLLTLLFLL